MAELGEPLSGLFSRSKQIILDFAQIDTNIQNEANLEQFFKQSLASGNNPRHPSQRQAFNNKLLQQSGYRYLIGRYREERAALLADVPAGREGRTIHMAIDIFSRDLEPVIAPCDGEIVRSNYEEGFGEYGNYLILKPLGADYYIFFGHLAKDRVGTGPVATGQILAHLGDYHDNENGGWSRHLHLQMLKELPPEGDTPLGYSTKKDFNKNALKYPDPMQYFTKWKIDV